MSAIGSDAGNDAGTTLLELLVVMGLMVLLTTLAFPAIERSLELFEMRQTAGVLEANLRLVRSDAVRSGQSIAFTVASDGKSYGWSEGELRRMPGGIDIRTANGQAIQFYGDGTTSGGEIITSSDGRRIAIDVDDATGAVSPGQ
jgi:general secretion pathway protein H